MDFFVCAGAQKAATTWLYSQLRTHPDIFLPPIKELQFFNHVHCPAHRAWTRHSVVSKVNQAIAWHHQNSPKRSFQIGRLEHILKGEMFTDDWYRSIFDGSDADGKLCGDICPNYAYIGQAGISHLKSCFDRVKVIFVLRDPIDRAASHQRMLLSVHGNVPETEEDWLSLNLNGVIDWSRYSAFLPLWQAAFEPDDFLLLRYDWVKNDPDYVMRTIEDFLGVPRHQYKNLRDTVHGGYSITVPASVHAALAEALAHEQQFYRDCFE